MGTIGRAPGNYVTGTAAARDAGAVAVPRGNDGRPGSCAPAEQAAWGWGLAPAAREPADRALTDLPANPVGYCARQQDAARRDLGREIGEYGAYRPEPFAG